MIAAIYHQMLFDEINVKKITAKSQTQALKKGGEVGKQEGTSGPLGL